MKLLKAVVTGTVDPIGSIGIPAELLRGNLPITAYYTSPFNSIFPGEGGFTAYPRTGDVILVATADDGSDLEYFYMSTVVGSFPGLEGALPNYPKGSDKFLTGNSYKDTVGLKDHHNSGVEFVYESSEGGDSGVIRRSYAQLYAGSNKIKLTRNIDSEGILIETSDTSPRVMLRMNNSGNAGGSGPCSFTAKSYGNMNFHTTVGDMKLSNSGNGGVIQIVNFATRDGDGSILESPLNKKKGNVNIDSWHNSININAFAYKPLTPPRVFVRTQPLHRDGVVQLKTGGTIEIVANDLVATVGTNPVSGKITIWASKGIDIFTQTGDINISAPLGQVNLQPLIPAGIAFIPTLNSNLL
tara:strand:+ start:582 stop:1646 length:1065 start_codon:yes stop_codon:yes gene_type:complete